MRRLLPVALALALPLAPSRAQARRFFRARFEPETLELQKPGELELDAQLGGFYGDGPNGSRLVMPDVELDLGLTRWLEVDLDAALSVTELEKRDKPLAGDPIFLSARFDAYSWKSPRSSATFGVGFQLGPRFPSVNTPRGVGFGGLVLFGGGSSDFHLVGNAGSVFDRGQSRAIAYGLDWDAALGHALSLIGDVSVVQYFGSDPAQLLVDVGASYKPSPALELFALAIAGPALRGDRAGGLVGVAYTYRVFHVGE